MATKNEKNEEMPNGESNAGSLLCRDTTPERERHLERLDRLANLARFRQLFET